MSQIRTALNALLSAPQFQALEDRLRDRSIFHVLGIEAREIYHSRLLAWLLDPREGHGLGTRPLRTFMLLAARLGQRENTIDSVAIDELDLDAVTVSAEFTLESGRRPDLVALIDDRPILLVEYKVDADEGEDQTADYARWAQERATALNTVLPLLVFLCPDRDDQTQPSLPFVHVAYEPYCAWLDALLEHARDERTRVLVREFRACIGQREDVEAPEQEALVRDLVDLRYARDVFTLRSATRDELREHEAVIRRHEAAFSRLGISVGRRASHGRSAFVVATRRALAKSLAPDLWDLGGGDGCIVGVFKPALEAVRRHFKVDSNQVLRVQIFMDRPRNEKCRLGGEIVRRVPGLDEAQTRDVRCKFAESARRAIVADGFPEQFLARGASLFALKRRVNGLRGLEDDTDETAEKLTPLLEELAAVVRSCQGALLRWSREELPRLLEGVPAGP